MQAIERFWEMPVGLSDDDSKPNRSKESLVQTHASERRPQIPSAPASVEKGSATPHVAIADVPSELDLAASPATQCPVQRTLLRACLDLLFKCDAGMIK